MASMLKVSSFAPSASNLRKEFSERFIEQSLQDNNKKYADKISDLSVSWTQLKDCLNMRDEKSKFLDLAKCLTRHSILMVLKAEWKGVGAVLKTHLKKQVSECAEKLKQLDESMAPLCLSVLHLLDDPWGNDTLKIIFQDKPYDDFAAQTFLLNDRHILKMRLNSLCEIKPMCFDLAQRLAAVVWKYYRLQNSIMTFLPEDELHYILDLYLVLLVNLKQHNVVIDQMKDLPYHQGLQFIRRLKNQKHPRENVKPWKKSRKTAEIVAHVFATRAITESTTELGPLLNEFLTEWVDLYNTANEFPQLINQLAAKALSADQMFALSNALNKKLPGKHRLTCIQLYIKGLSMEANNVEHIRTLQNNVELRTAEENLSTGFLQLAALLSDRVNECRECVLTAFSFNPTEECHARVRKMAVRSGMCVEELLDTGQPEHNTMEAFGIDRHRETEISDSDFQIPQDTQDDLNALLMGPRNRVLNWHLNWPDLNEKCKTYVEEMKGERPITKELLYLDIDYSKYAHLPTTEDENHDGIEKGYELDNESGTADDDFDLNEDYINDFTTSPSDASSDASFRLKKKSKPIESIDPNRKKTKSQRTPKRSNLSSDDCKSRLNINDNCLVKKVKNQRKAKRKTPKSDAKRNGKSSVVQFQVSSGKDPRNSLANDCRITNDHSNHSNLGNYSNLSLPEDLRKIINCNRAPRDEQNLATLRTYRRKKNDQLRLHPKIALEKNPNIEMYSDRKASGYKEPYALNVPGLNSFEMMVPPPQRTTVQVVQVPNSTSTVSKPEEDQGTSSDQMNGSTISNNQSGNAGGVSDQSSHQEINSQPAPNLVKLADTCYSSSRVGNTNVAIRPSLQAVTSSGSAQHLPVQAPALALLSGRGIIRRDVPGLAHVQRRNVETSQNWTQRTGTPVTSPHLKAAEERTSTTALPQFSQAFGFGRQDSSALKQALLAADNKPTLNSTAAGFGSQTQPAGFGAPARPPGPGLGVQTQVPPLQQRLQTALQPSSLQPQPEQQLQQEQTSILQLQQGQSQATAQAEATAQVPAQATAQATGFVTVHLSPTAGTQATQAGIQTATTTTPQVIVKTSGSTTMISATPPPGLLLTPGLTPVGTSSTSPLTAAACITTANTTLVSTTGHRSVVMVTNTKATAAAVPAAGLPTRQSLPALVQRTYSCPASLEKARATQSASSSGQGEVPRPQSVSGIQTSSQPNVQVDIQPSVPVGQASCQPVLPALVQTSNQPSAAQSSFSAVSSSAAVKRNRNRVSTSVLKQPQEDTFSNSVGNSTSNSAGSSVDISQSSSSTTTTAVSTTATVTSATQTAGTPTSVTSSPGTPTPGAAAAAAAATAAAAAAAASAPTNISRPLFPSTPPSDHDILKAQLLEFESVLHHVHTTRQSQERQSLTEEGTQPKPVRPVQTDASVQAGPQSLGQSKVNSTAQATTQTVQTVVQANIQTVPKTIVPSTVTLSTSFTQTASQTSSSLPGTPKKKAKIIKSLTVSATGNVSLAPESRSAVLKPAIIHTISSAKAINQKITEDEETTARILSILRQYDEQLRCSPEINNKPAPRRRNQAQPGSSPNSKRKHKKNKNSISELSPGTDDTHTMGSEDSSIASHFAEGVLEATPTSPLSTCDDRSVASTVTTSGEVTPVSASTTVTSFAGVTKSSSSTIESGDIALSSTESPGQKNQNVSKVQISPKAQSPTKVQVLARAQASPKLLTMTKAPPLTKVQNIAKVQMLSKTQVVQTVMKGQTSPKARPLPKVSPTVKVLPLAPQVSISPPKTSAVSPVSSVSAPPQVLSVPSLTDGQISSVSQVSRVIQSVESLKPSQSPIESASTSEIQSQGSDISPQIVPTSSGGSHLARALQSSKQASQTPLLAKALETPAVPLPTSFAGILKTAPKLNITQPSTPTSLRNAPKLEGNQILKMNQLNFPGIESTSTLPSVQVSQSSQTVNSLTSPQQILLTSKSAQSSEVLLKTNQPSQVVEVPSSMSLTTTVLPQRLVTVTSQSSKVQTTFQVQNPQDIQLAQLDTSSQTVQSSPHEQTAHLTMSPPELLTTTEIVLPSTHQQGTLQIIQPAPKMRTSPHIVQLTSLKQATSTADENCLKEKITSHMVQLDLEGQKTLGAGTQVQQNSQIMQQQSQVVSAQPIIQNVQPALQVQQTSQIAQPQLSSQILQPVSQGQLTSQIQLTPQIVHSVSQGQLTPQILQATSQAQSKSQILQIVSQASSVSQMVQTVSQVSPISQIVIPASQVHTSHIVQSAPQMQSSQLVQTSQMQPPSMIQTSSQTQMSQIIHTTPQLVQSLHQSTMPQLVQSSKSPHSHQRYAVQPVQLSAAHTPQLRRIHPTQLSLSAVTQGECPPPQLVQIAQPQLVQTALAQQLQSSQPLLLTQTSQAVTVTHASPVKQAENDGSKMIVVVSSSPSVMVPSTTGMLHMAGSMQVPVVLRHLQKPGDGKLQVINCDPNLLSAVQQYLSGNSAPVVSSGHLGTAVTTQTSATVVSSSAPLFSVPSAVDTSVVTDTSVLSHGSVPVSSDTLATPPIPISMSSASQQYPPLIATTQAVISSPLLDATASSQAVPRAITPSSASNIPPPTNTSPSGAPARPTTLLALQKQSQQFVQQQLRNKQLRQQGEEDSKQTEMQKIQNLHRLSQPQPFLTEVSQQSQLIVTNDSQPSTLPEIYQSTQPGSQQMPLSSVLQGQLESQGPLQDQHLHMQKQTQVLQPIRQLTSPRKLNTSLPKAGRPSLITATPLYKPTEPKQLKQLLEQAPAPLPPLCPTVKRRLSYTSTVSSASVVVSDPSKAVCLPLKQPEDQQRTEVLNERMSSTLCVDQQEKHDQMKLSPEKLLVKSVACGTPTTFSIPVVSSQEVVAEPGRISPTPSSEGHSTMISPEKHVFLPQEASSLCSSEKFHSTSPEKQSFAPSSGTLPQENSLLNHNSPVPVNRAPALSEEVTLGLSSEKMSSTSLSPASSLNQNTSSLPAEVVLPASHSQEQQPSLGKQLSPSKCPLLKQPNHDEKNSSNIEVSCSTISSVVPLQIPKTKSSEKLPSTVKVVVMCSDGPTLQHTETANENRGEALSQSFEAGIFKQGGNSSSHGNTELSNPAAEVVVTNSATALVEAISYSDELCNLRIPTEIEEKSHNGCLQQSSEQTKPPLLAVLSTNQVPSQKSHQTFVLEAPPLTLVQVSKPVETQTSKVVQPPIDIGVNLKEQHIKLSVQFQSEDKPANPLELRVYPAAQGCVDSGRSQLLKVKPTTSESSPAVSFPSPPMLPTSMQIPSSTYASINRASAEKAKMPLQIPIPSLKPSSVSVMQTSSEACIPPLTQTTTPLVVHKPLPAKALAVIQPQTSFQSPTLQNPSAAVHQHCPAVSTSSEDTQPNTSSKASTTPKRRQRSKKQNSPVQNSVSQTSQLQSDFIVSSPPLSLPKPQQLSPSKQVDQEVSPSKRPNKKKKDKPDIKERETKPQIIPEIVSQHMSDTIMRVSLGVDEDPNVREDFHSQLVKDVYYEGQESIPVEVAVAALCGEDIEIGKDLIEGNLQGDIKTRGAITLLPADPSDNAEEVNFLNVIPKTEEDQIKLEEQRHGSTCDGSIFNPTTSMDETAVKSAMNSPTENCDLNTTELLTEVKSEGEDSSHLQSSSDSLPLRHESELTLSILKSEPSITIDDNSLFMKKESDLVVEIKDDDAVPTKSAQKRKTASHAGSFSEHSRSLSGSEDLSMDKTSTSDIFPPETDLLFDNTLSPSFLGEIAQMSPSCSQDAVSTSPEPPEKKKKCFLLKTGILNRVQTTAHEFCIESVPKLELEDSDKGQPRAESIAIALSSIDNLNQFNGEIAKTDSIIVDPLERSMQESEYIFPSTETVVPHSSISKVQMPAETISEPIISSHENHAWSSLSASSSVAPCFSSVKSGSGSGESSADDAPWMKEPLYSLTTSDNEDDEFWATPLKSDADVDIINRGETNNSIPSSDSISLSFKPSARPPRRSLTSQAKRGGVKRSSESVDSPGRKQPGEKRKRVSSVASSNEEDENISKHGSITRSSAAKAQTPVRRADASPKEEAQGVRRRVSSRTHKPVTKFDEPHRKIKPSSKQYPKTIAHKKK